jgi:hypothetical protein
VRGGVAGKWCDLSSIAPRSAEHELYTVVKPLGITVKKAVKISRNIGIGKCRRPQNYVCGPREKTPKFGKV